jgi:aspartate aminotransferase-like enzyme
MGFTIYPGKISQRFRLANIGAITPEDIRRFLEALGEVLIRNAIGDER